MNLTQNFKQFAKYVSYWTLPSGIQDIARVVKKQLLNSNTLSVEEKSILEHNKALQNIHKGERCFILATGPSIKNIDLKQLKNENCIAVSHFYLHPDFQFIKPRYYCIAPWHPPHPPEAYNQMLRVIGSEAKETTFFLGTSEYQRVNTNKIALGSQVYYLNFGANNSELIEQGIDLSKPVLSPQSVTIMALQIAIYMGFKEIYLLGFDHNSITNRTRQFANQHFYSEEKSILVTDIGSFKQALESYLRLWSQYETCNSIADSLDIKILNATDGSYLDVFKYISLDMIFQDVYKI